MIFPQTSQWVEENLADERKREFEEMRRVVGYHFDFTMYSRQACLTMEPGVGLLFSGDTAVREASSAFDTSLHLINSALGFGIHPRDIVWKFFFKLCDARASGCF